MSRILGLDYGAKTVGVAISDELMLTAQGLEIVRRESENKRRKTLARLQEIVETYGVSEIVLGYPKRLDGSEGERCEKTQIFREELKKRTGLPVTLWDERLTTVAAENAMNEAGLSREKQKENVDRIAAVLILQGYLDSRSTKN